MKRKKRHKGIVRRRLFSIALPMILCHILQTFFNTVDFFWIGQLGVSELAGVSWAANILMVFTTIIVGISIGTSAIVSRCVGAKDYEEASRTAWHALILGGIVAIILSVVGYLYIEDALLALGAEENIATIGSRYLRVTFLGSIVLLLMFLSTSILQGAGNMRTPVYATIVATCVNLILDPLLIFGYGVFPCLGVEGAALATVIARGLGAMICIYSFFNAESRIHLKLTVMKLNLSIFVRILKVGIPGSIHMSMRSVMSLAMIVIVGHFGYKAVAAYGIGLNLFNFAMMPGFGLGAAASILVGQHLGAGRRAMAMQSALIPAFYNIIIMQIFALLFVAFSKPILSFFTNDFEVIRLGIDYLKITTISYFCLGAGFVLSRALNGAGDTSSGIIINMVCLWFIQIPLALFYAIFWGMGLKGVWWGILVASTLQAGSTCAWFLVQEWKKSKV